MSGETFRVRRTFQVGWNQRWDFLEVMMGYATLDDASEFPYTVINRATPNPYYLTHDNIVSTPLYPVAFERIKPIGKPSWSEPYQATQFDNAEVTLLYESLTHRIREDVEMLSVLGSLDESSLYRYTTVFIQPTVEYLTLPFGAFKWVEPQTLPPIANNGCNDGTNFQRGAQVTGSNGRLVPYGEVMISWHRVPGYPSNAVDFLGTVNRIPFGRENTRYYWPAETLLYTNVDIKPYRWFRNELYYDVNMKFKQFDPELDGLTGHNHFLHYRTDGTIGFDLITRTGCHTDSRVYEGEIFDEIFTTFSNTTE